MTTITPSVYPAHGDPRSALARRSLPSAHLGTLESLVPGLVPLPIAYADLPPDERMLHEQLAKLFCDMGEAMKITRAFGAHDVGLSLTDQLYDARNYRMRVSIPYSTAHPTHPGTVLVSAISELSCALRTNPAAGAPFDPRPLLDLSDWLGGYCELFPLGSDPRRVAPHRLHEAIRQLITYYA